jgi:hypothetical protein
MVMSHASPEEHSFDGRIKYPLDDEIESLLEEHFRRFGTERLDMLRNFQLYVRRALLRRFLAHYEIFRMTVNLPGDVVELGVFRGTSLMSWANFLEIRNIGDRSKRVIGFDIFSGFPELDARDGPPDVTVGKAPGGFDMRSSEQELRDVISIFDRDRFIGFKPRVILVKGNIEETVPRFFADNPGIRISLLHFDCDLYKPTKRALDVLWPLVVPGGVVIFDEYAIAPWEGESRAVEEFFTGRAVELQKFDWSSSPGAYMVKKPGFSA